MSHKTAVRVGEIRPSQIMFTNGVGAIIDLPKLSVIITGLEDWPVNPQYSKPIIEERLLMAVRYQLPQVRQLLNPPVSPEQSDVTNPFDSVAKIGVPVAVFPRWMTCPQCQLLAPVETGLFKLKEDHFHSDRTVYRHETCNKAKNPEVIPARFLVACEAGHLDDFPWMTFVHKGTSCENPLLRLIEYGTSGDARDVEVRCESCGQQRRLAEAFGKENRENMPLCRGRRPHLRDFDLDECEHKMRSIILGASNTWFPVVYSSVAIPVDSGRLDQLVDENWVKLQQAIAPMIIDFMRNTGQLGALSDYENDEIWQAVEKRRQQDAGDAPLTSEKPDLKEPEWQIFTQYDSKLNSKDFRLRPVQPPQRFSDSIEQVVLVERMREVRAMVGFTRLDAFGELTDPDLSVYIKPASISRKPPTWVPAHEVRGEGIFIQFNERKINEWLAKTAVQERSAEFWDAHQKWRIARYIEPPEKGFPGMRYILIHTFAHALMRQLALECGYSTASIRERIYARNADQDSGPMAGVLIYTAAPDSEGTLGGLVSLGEPDVLGRHLSQALETATLCASDPLCAEHPPSQRGRTLHAAACHACMFLPETSCERGNKYLDRSTLVPTLERDDLAFFD